MRARTMYGIILVELADERGDVVLWRVGRQLGDVQLHVGRARRRDRFTCIRERSRVRAHHEQRGAGQPQAVVSHRLGDDLRDFA